MEKVRLFQVQLLWNARTFEQLALVWGDLAKANRIAEAVWADFTSCCTCGGGDCVEDFSGHREAAIQADGTYQECRAVHHGGASLMVSVEHVTVPQRLKLNELRDALRLRSLPTGGSKEALAARLEALLDLTPLPGAR